MIAARIHANGGAIASLSRPRFRNMGMEYPARTIASGLNMNIVAVPRINAVFLRSVIVFFSFLILYETVHFRLSKPEIHKGIVGAVDQIRS